MYTRLKEEGLKIIADTISVSLRDKDEMLVKEKETNKENPVDFVENFSFINNERLIANAISFDFEHFFNLNNKLAERLSLFIDDKLRIVGKGVTEQEIENILNKTMVPFRFLREKGRICGTLQGTFS
ncbi:hypothetical protein GQX74_008929 [Glossina fuscipes]|nr:hypothetical protein GQX74_008929 [Glossina fuscipes]